MKALLFVSVLALGLPAWAGITVYSGDGGEKLYIEKNSSGAFAKVEGIEGEWNGKILKVERQERPSGERFVIPYTTKGGREKNEYQMVIGDGKTLINGSVVPAVKLYTKGGKNPTEMHQDAELTKSSQSMSLQKELEKAPFTPKF